MGCTHAMRGRSRVSMDPRIPIMPGRSTSGYRRPGRHCLHQARSAVRCWASRMKGELHPKNRFLRRTFLHMECVRGGGFLAPFLWSQYDLKNRKVRSRYHCTTRRNTSKYFVVTFRCKRPSSGPEDFMFAFYCLFFALLCFA